MANALDDGQIERMLEGIRIPTQPVLLQKVTQLVRAADPDLRAVADVVSGDVGLSAAVLKTVNSPFFGLRNPVSSIHNATSLLGLKNVVSIVTSLSLRAAMDSKGLRLDRFWDSANDTALACAGLARELRIGSPDEAHTLGLFHDCGIPLLMQKFPNYVEVLRQGNSNAERSLTTVEDAQLGTNHAVVAYYVAKSWRLPDLICQTILQHHEMETLGADDLGSRVAMLALAEQIAHHHRRASDNFEWERVRGRVLEILCLSDEECDDLIAEVSDLLAT